MSWSIVILEPARSWLHSLRRTDRVTLDLITDAIRALSSEGPALGRPLVDTVKGSRLANLKELRPGSRGAKKVRILFVFDPLRRAVIPVGGDKAGRWRSWYRSAIPIAEAAYAEHLKCVEEETR